MGDDRWFVGIDLGSEQHQAVVVDERGLVRDERVVAHSGGALRELCQWLTAVTGKEPAGISVAIETPRGPVVETLLSFGFVVFSINPKQLDRFRDRFTMAGAKDDRLDARVLADSLRTNEPLFRRLEADDPIVIELREWSRVRDDVEQQRHRLTNRVRDQLHRYFPQMLQVCSDPGAQWFLDLWRIVPTPEKAQRIKLSTIAGVLRRSRIRKIAAQQVLDLLRQPALPVSLGTVRAATSHIELVARQLRLIHRQLKDCEQKLDELCAQLGKSEIREQRDVEILQSLPGVGRIVLATLLAEAWKPLRARDYRALRSLSGTAPVTQKSGKKRSVGMRRACHQRLRFAVYHWTRGAIQKDAKSRQAYRALRARGATHGRAIRGVADRLLKMACAMLRDGTIYDSSRRKVAQAA
jgi:transposase